MKQIIPFRARFALQRRKLHKIALLAFSASLYVVEMSLGIRFVMKLAGAHVDLMFTRAFYELTDPLTRPFQDVFHVTPVHVQATSTPMVDVPAMFAFVAYPAVLWTIMELIRIIRTTERPARGRQRSMEFR